MESLKFCSSKFTFAKAKKLHDKDYLQFMLSAWGEPLEILLRLAEESKVGVFTTANTPFDASFALCGGKLFVLIQAERIVQDIDAEEHFLFVLMHELGHVFNGEKAHGFSANSLDEVEAWRTA